MSKQIICKSSDNLMIIRTPEEAVSDKFMSVHEQDMKKLDALKEEFRQKMLNRN